MDGPARGDDFRPCAVIPTYDNPATIRSVVEEVGAFLPVVVVDDGSAPQGRAEVESLGREGLAHVHHREENGGKGAAVRSGLRLCRDLGYTHALQIDADGQHDLEDVPRFLDAARENPGAIVLGAPVYDESAPLIRIMGRQLTRFWTNVETFVGPQNHRPETRRAWGRSITDPMCGFRVYPVDATCAVVDRCGSRMDFDIEVAVRVVWEGVTPINLPTEVRYPPDGVSHFHMIRDNARITWAHMRLVGEGVLRGVTARATGRGRV